MTLKYLKETLAWEAKELSDKLYRPSDRRLLPNEQYDPTALRAAFYEATEETSIPSSIDGIESCMEGALADLATALREVRAVRQRGQESKFASVPALAAAVRVGQLQERRQGIFDQYVQSLRGQPEGTLLAAIRRRRTALESLPTLPTLTLDLLTANRLVLPDFVEVERTFQTNAINKVTALVRTARPVSNEETLQNQIDLLLEIDSEQAKRVAQLETELDSYRKDGSLTHGGALEKIRRRLTERLAITEERDRMIKDASPELHDQIRREFRKLLDVQRYEEEEEEEEE